MSFPTFILWESREIKSLFQGRPGQEERIQLKCNESRQVWNFSPLLTFVHDSLTLWSLPEMICAVNNHPPLRREKCRAEGSDY